MVSSTSIVHVQHYFKQFNPLYIMELKESEKELAIAILSVADGEDVDEIVDRSCFKDYLTRSLILQAPDIDLEYILEERKREKISIV